MFGAFENLARIVGVGKKILDSGLGVVQARVELLSAELQAERRRIFRMMLLAAGVVSVGILTLGLFTATIVFAFSENLRVYALAGLTILYAAGTVLLYLKLDRQLRNSRPLSGTLAEIKRDREALNSGNGSAPDR